MRVLILLMALLLAILFSEVEVLKVVEFFVEWVATVFGCWMGFVILSATRGIVAQGAQVDAGFCTLA